MLDPIVSILAQNLTQEWSVLAIVAGIMGIVLITGIPYYLIAEYFQKKRKMTAVMWSSVVFIMSVIGLVAFLMVTVFMPLFMSYQDCSREGPATLQTETGTYETTITYCRFREYKGSEWTQWEPAITRDNNWEKVSN